MVNTLTEVMRWPLGTVASFRFAKVAHYLDGIVHPYNQTQAKLTREAQSTKVNDHGDDEPYYPDPIGLQHKLNELQEVTVDIEPPHQFTPEILVEGYRRHLEAEDPELDLDPEEFAEIPPRIFFGLLPILDGEPGAEKTTKGKRKAK